MSWARTSPDRGVNIESDLADLPVNIESDRPIPARSIESVSLDLDPRKSLSPLWSFRKPYVYGASRLGLRPLLADGD